MIPPRFKASIYWKKSILWHNFCHPFYLRVSFFHRSAWSDPYVKDAVFITQYLLQPSIITSGLWLIREKLKSMFISGKQLWPCSFKGINLFHRSTCDNFCLFEKYCVKCLKALSEIPFVLYSDCKYSKCFRRATVAFSTFKGEFRNSYFLLVWQFHTNNCR